MTGDFVLVGGLFGLLVGSFFNVVVYRTPRHLSVVSPGSFCPSCKAEIGALDNVPLLSWIVLRGKCRHCGHAISVRYPLVEAATAGVFAGLAATVRPLWGVPGWWALAAALGVAAVIEGDGQVCPPAVTVIGTSIGAAGLAIGAATAGHGGPVFGAGVGLGAGILCAGVVAATTCLGPKELRDRGGTGTAIVLAPFGACLGWLGPIPAVVGTALGLACGLVASQVVRKRRGPGGISPWVRFPLATCAALGVVAALLTAGIRS